MSAHYLIDLFATPPLSAPVTDVLEPPNGQTLINGSYVVRVPDSVPIAAPLPSDLSTLLTRKYAGLLSFFVGFTNIVYDDMTDPSGVNQTVTNGSFGQRGCIALPPGATLQSVTVPLLSAPTAAIFTWEVFQYIDADPKANRFTRTYNELPTSATYTTATVSFNNGGTFLPAVDGGVVNVPGGDQGTNLVVRITNATAGRLYIGSWALIY